MKKSKPYLQPEAKKQNAAEPVIAYNSRITLELEAEKARIIRAIANIDSRAVFDKVKQQLREVLNLKDEEIVEEVLEPDSKEYIMAGLKDAFRELEEMRAGKIRFHSIEEVLQELDEEAEKDD